MAPLSRELRGGRGRALGPRATSVAGSLVPRGSPGWIATAVGVGRFLPGRGRGILAAGVRAVRRWALLRRL
eukprot:9108868-Pyramimonas_sp.AAC.1